MSRGEEHKRVSLADKLAGFSPEPPESVWEGVAAQVQSGKRRRFLFIILSSAAAVLFAVTVGIRFIIPEGDVELASEIEHLDEGAGRLGMIDETESFTEDEGVLHDADSEEIRKKDFRIKESRTKKESVEELVREVILEQEKNREILAQRNEPSLLEQTQLLHEEGLKTEDREHLQDDSGEKNNVEKNTEGEEQMLVEGNVGEGLAAVDSVNDGGAMTMQEAEAILAEKKEEGEIAEEIVEDEKKWQVGAILSPQYSYRDAASPDRMQNSIVNSAESGKLTYSTGLHVSFAQNDRLTIESGVFYNKMGVNIGDYSVFGFLDGWRELDNVYMSEEKGDRVVSISNSMGSVVSSDNSLYLNTYGAGENLSNDYHLMSPENMSVEGEDVQYLSQSFEYLEIPLNVRYKIYDSDLVVQLIGGMSTNFLINNRLDAVTYNLRYELGEVQDIRAINYSGNAGIGFLYSLFDNLTLCVEPRFKYYLNSINTASLPSTRPYAFGLQTGVSYSF